MMLPLCTRVTLLLCFSTAYLSAARTRRSVPPRETNLLVVFREVLLEQAEQRAHALGAGFELDPRVDIFGVLAKDDHVHLFGSFHRRGNTAKIAHRSQADVEVEHLSERDIERADAAADRRG